jgi:hypothetical protein
VSVPTFIAKMRTKQAALFSDELLITADGPPGALDPETAQRAPGAAITVYEGPGLVRPEGDSVADIGEGSTSIDAYIVKVPPDTALALGQAVTVTASTFDAGLADVTLRIVHVFHDGWQIARKARAVDERERPA